MIGIYFSGTGNTKYCVEQFLKELGGGEAVPMEETDRAVKAIWEHQEILLGYPTYYSNLPVIVRDFLGENGPLFAKKRVFLLTTMGLFSGDGTGCAARVLRRCGAEITGGLQVKMPDCIGDVKALKKPLEENRAIVRAAGETVRESARRYRAGRPTRDGLGPAAHAAGLLGQRLWFLHAPELGPKKLRIDRAACVGCGKCVQACPVGNLRLEGGKAAAGTDCTMCYRCFSLCPQKAVTLLGREVLEQSRVEKYL